MLLKGEVQLKWARRCAQVICLVSALLYLQDCLPTHLTGITFDT